MSSIGLFRRPPNHYFKGRASSFASRGISAETQFQPFIVPPVPLPATSVVHSAADQHGRLGELMKPPDRKWRNVHPYQRSVLPSFGFPVLNSCPTYQGHVSPGSPRTPLMTQQKELVPSHEESTSVNMIENSQIAYFPVEMKQLLYGMTQAFNGEISKMSTQQVERITENMIEKMQEVGVGKTE